VSYRYGASYLDPGLNTLVAPPPPTYTYNLYAWGSNNGGQLGLSNTGSIYSSPTQVGSLTNWLNISAAYSSFGIKTDGTLWSWGFNNFGQLGLNNRTYYSSPKQVGLLTNWSTISQTKNNYLNN